MKKHLIFFLLTVCLFPLALAQISMVGCNAQWLGTTYTVNPTGTTNDGGTIRNTFETTPIDGTQGCPGFGFGFCEMRVIYSIANSRWEIDLTDGGGSFFTMYFNTSASIPNPPDLTLGTWVENTALTGGGCGGAGTLTTFSGDVQSTVVLPVSWASFEASKAEEGVLLNWATYNELNSKSFEVERSTDAIHYSSIGTIAAQGNSSTLTKYKFLDANSVLGENLYRLKQIDQDGSFSYSKILSVHLPNYSTQIVHLDENHVQIQYPFEPGAHLVFFDIKGNKFIDQIITAKKDQVIIEIPSISRGIYFLQIKDRRGLQSKKWMRN